MCLKSGRPSCSGAKAPKISGLDYFCRSTGRGDDEPFLTAVYLTEGRKKRKLDETGVSEINRLYPKSRRKGLKKDQYLKSLPRKGRLEEENGRTRTKLEYVMRARMEERRKGGLTAPKRVRGAPKTQWEGKCCYFFVVVAAGMKKKGVCKGNLQTTQQV
ncbi:hypothetical protein TNCV_1466191 [Trichonephila clavipes]|nr:hypothetical protein TNCV_1466191 [Trichonephila clavipes]